MPSAKLHRETVSHVASPHPAPIDNQPQRPQPSIPRSISTCKSNSDLTRMRVYQDVQSTYLRSGLVFQGMQQSGRSQYQVKVKFHYVDLPTSFLCGFLRIQGLSLDNPSLTTYFEAEIVGPHYSFLTRHPEWGATERTDLDHWTKFPALKQSRGGKTIKSAAWDKLYKRPLEREYIFMRWKEQWLVSAEPNDPVSFEESFMRNNPAQYDHPNNLVSQLEGVSFTGYYYISFHQPTGCIHGMYYSDQSEQFQQLDLSPVNPSRPTFATFEFR